ncbi:MAG TPA: ABC transporter substrate-binding protein [Anaerolineales bacterium]|nr:ABC transporter substrate-binding protein [Anaerolineales bacterium]
MFQQWALPAILIVGIIAIGLWFGFGRTNTSEQPTSRQSQTSAPETSEHQEAPPTGRPTENMPPEPENQPLPGRVIIPIDNLAPEIPWLPLDLNAIPATTSIVFNVNSPPFDDPMVRKAFAAAIDRETVAVISGEAFANNTAQPATTLVPPDILGLSLYGEIGIPFDPDPAREYLAVAGYPNGENFPPVTIMVNENEPNYVIFDAVIQMWMEILNIQVRVEYIPWEGYTETIYNDRPPIFRFGWGADMNDPENFMQIYRTDSEFNHSGFSNPRYDELIERALEIINPAERQELYIEAERILCEEETVIIPLYHFAIISE